MRPQATTGTGTCQVFFYLFIMVTVAVAVAVVVVVLMVVGVSSREAAEKEEVPAHPVVPPTGTETSWSRRRSHREGEHEEEHEQERAGNTSCTSIKKPGLNQSGNYCTVTVRCFATLPDSTRSISSQRVQGITQSSVLGEVVTGAREAQGCSQHHGCTVYTPTYGPLPSPTLGFSRLKSPTSPPAH